MALRPTRWRLDKIIIVESPTKTASFSKYVNAIMARHKGSLGFDNAKLKALDLPNQRVNVVATIGHFKEMHEIEFTWNDAGAEVQSHWSVSSGKDGVVKNIKSLVNQAPKGSEFIIATDPDREGELIGIHAFSLLPAGVSFSRMYVHAITEEGIETALRERHLKFLDRQLGNAADTRHCMDRIFGFLGSRVVNHWHNDLKSIGRVQTPSLILLHERAAAIKEAEENKSVSYSVVLRLVEGSGSGSATGTAKARDTVVSFVQDGRKKLSKFAVKEEADRALKGLTVTPGATAAAFHLLPHGKKGWVRRTTSTVQPPEPLTMQTLILEAGKKLGMSSADVAANAQRLFGLGLITYPRTDSTRIGEETVVTKIHPHIAQHHGKENIRTRAPKTAEGDAKKAGKKKKAKATEAAEGNVEDAHEAIHPTNFSMLPKTSKLSDLVKDPRAEQLYAIIHAATVAAFMVPHERETAAVTFGVGKDATFAFSASRVQKSGWKAVFQSAVQESSAAKAAAAKAKASEEEETQPEQEEEESDSEALFQRLVSLTPETAASEPPLFTVGAVGLRESQSRPPPHYTEGTLIQDLKDHGIGRPSTYPTIVKTLEGRGYAVTHGQRLVITPLGENLVKLAQTFFPTVVDISFTKTFESELDAIALGKGKTMDTVITDFNAKFFDMITQAASSLPGPDLAVPRKVEPFATGARSLKNFSGILNFNRQWLGRFVPANAGKLLVQPAVKPGTDAPETRVAPASPTPTASTAGTIVNA